MSSLAHIAGLPLEEILLPLAAGGAGALLVARGWLMTRIRRGRGPGS